MKLADNYWHALDKQAAQNLDVSPTYIGISTPPMRGQVEELQGRIFSGATHVELGFLGTQKGSMSQGATTPEMHSREEREAIRQMAKINEISKTTHVTPQMPSLSGFSDGQFRQEIAEAALHEIERTVDFAADTTRGGPVVVHTTPLPREVARYKSEGFEGYPEETERAPIYLVDDRTGGVVLSSTK